MKIICTPTRDTMYAGFVYDLTNLIRWTPDTVFTVSQGTLLPNLRTMLAKTAVQNPEISHVLFIDSDMRFPMNAMNHLVARNADIVGANCKQRMVNQWTARKGAEFVTSEGKKGVEEVDTLGFGVTLIKREVFEKLEEPWFATPWDGGLKKHVGEDVYFCQIAREAGFKILVDHDLSKEVRHAGLIEFGL